MAPAQAPPTTTAPAETLVQAPGQKTAPPTQPPVQTLGLDDL